MMITPFFSGLGLGAGLIVAIGAQNAHVLRIGLRQQHVALTIAVCILGEMILVGIGAIGVGSLVSSNRVLMEIARWAGAAFLAWYGVRAWCTALSQRKLEMDVQDRQQLSRRAALLSAAAVTFLNPHAYLDALVLLGSLGGKHGEVGRWWFALGAVCAATLWFSALGFGSRLLAPWFARPAAWRLLDGVVGFLMLLLSASLLFSDRWLAD